MKKKILHTPEGVRDIYNEECEKKLILQDCINEMLRRYGYRPIQTPTFEFFDIFGREIGTTPSCDLYKFFDREGNTLVLRPDITPSIARSAAKYFGEEAIPIRLCYMGNTFINSTRYQGRLKENTQLGAELIGDPSVDADAEMISMVVDCLRAAGLKDFLLSIGHADFFLGLMESAGLTEEQEEEFRRLISNKNFFGVEELAGTLHLDSDLMQLFLLLGKLYANPEELTELRNYAADYPRILSAVMRFEELYKILEVYGISGYVNFEPGIISDYRYYTGIIFSGYTFGSGEPIVRGGRYDKLLTYFGKDSASIGFAFIVDQLMAALSRQKIEIPLEHNTLLIVYSSIHREEAISHANEQRREGRCVELIVRNPALGEEDYIRYAEQNRIAEIRFV